MDHDELVQCIYDSAGAEQPFEGALAAIARSVDAPFAHVLVVDSRGQLAESHFHGHSGSPFASYEAHWRDRDPRFALGNANVGRVMSDVHVLDPAGFESSEIYNDFLQPMGVRYTLFGQLELDGGRLAAHAFMRDRRFGPFEAAHERAVARLLPHVRRSLGLRRLVGTLRDQLADLRAALDVVPAALSIVGATGGVLCANTAAERLFKAGDGLYIKDGQLRAQTPAITHKLKAALAQMAAFAEGARRGPAGMASPPVVEVTRERGRPLGLVLLPLRPTNTLRAEGHPQARVLVVFDDPEARTPIDPALLQRLYPLTPTEAQLAASLAHGHSVADFARERGCSEQTARTHLKRVLEKTETHRQAELVRVLLGSAALQIVGAR